MKNKLNKKAKFIQQEMKETTKRKQTK